MRQGEPAALPGPLLAIIALLAPATALAAQEGAAPWTAARAPELPASLQAQDLAPQRGHGPDFGLNAGAHVRWSLPFGAAHRDLTAISGPGGTVVFVDQKVSWSDLYDDGWGAEVEVDVYLREDEHGGFGRGETMRYGGFVSYSSDHYEGDGVTDDFGNRIESEDLNLTTILVGGKVETSMGGRTFGDARVGFGVAHYSAVEATFSGPGFPAFRTELFEETYTFAFDVRAHGGVELGPLNLVAGIGFRWLYPPSEGSGIDVDSGGFMTFDLEVGVEIGL